MDWSLVWPLCWQYRFLFWEAILVTLLLSAVTIVFGTILGVPLAFAKKSKNKVFRLSAAAYIEVFRAVPLLVLIRWIYFGFPTRIDGFFAAAIALVLNLAPFAAENIRAGLDAVSDSQRESGLALGMSPSQVNRRIVFPQAVRNILPNLMDQWITSVKLTSLASVIGVQELLNVSGQVITMTSLPLEVYMITATLYCLIIFALTSLARACEKRWIRKKGH